MKHRRMDEKRLSPFALTNTAHSPFLRLASRINPHPIFFNLHAKWRHTRVSQVESIPLKNTMYTTSGVLRMWLDQT